MSVFRQCKWKGTDESGSIKGELTGVECSGKGFINKRRELGAAEVFQFLLWKGDKGVKDLCRHITAESILHL